MRGAAATVLIVLVSSVLALLAMEVVLRFAEGDPLRIVDGVVLWHGDTPRASSEDIRRAVDDRTAFTIVGLGDSIMYGMSRGRDGSKVEKEDTYLEQTRRTLERKVKTPIRMLNLAVPGYNTRQEAAVYNEVAEQGLQSALVIVHWWEDDVQQYISDGVHVFDAPDITASVGPPGTAVPWIGQVSDALLAHSRVYDDLLVRFVVARGGGGRRDAVTPEMEWQAVCKELTGIEERGRRAGAHVLVLASPGLETPFARANAFLRQLNECGKTAGFQVIDLAEWLAGVPSKQIAMDSCHFNVVGHRLLGERLAAHILQNYAPQ
jgi:hypothetical protein